MSLAPHAASLRQLQYAVAVADARSFRRAAEQCGVSQPSLSAQLAQLEGALGVRLFERDRRRVLLDAGRARSSIERARRVLVDADDLVDAARRLGDPLAGTLRHRRHPDHLALPAAGGGARHPPRAPAPDRALAWRTRPRTSRASCTPGGSTPRCWRWRPTWAARCSAR